MNVTQGGANLHPGVNLLPGANLHPGANCAHEHGLRCSREANSVFPDRIWPNFELIQALMYVIVTCIYEKDLIKNS